MGGPSLFMSRSFPEFLAERTSTGVRACDSVRREAETTGQRSRRGGVVNVRRVASVRAPCRLRSSGRGGMRSGRGRTDGAEHAASVDVATGEALVRRASRSSRRHGQGCHRRSVDGPRGGPGRDYSSLSSPSEDASLTASTGWGTPSAGGRSEAPTGALPAATASACMCFLRRTTGRVRVCARTATTNAAATLAAILLGAGYPHVAPQIAVLAELATTPIYTADKRPLASVYALRATRFRIRHASSHEQSGAAQGAPYADRGWSCG
jgi:hypothetical protein